MLSSINNASVQLLDSSWNLNPRELLCTSLKGLKIQIPDLRPIFDDWEGTYQRRINQHLQSLRFVVKERLQTLGLDPIKLQRLEAADFGLFTALWWPDVPLEKARILAYLVIWLFSWDDEIDEPTGSHSNDIKAAQVYRAETLSYVRYHLGLSSGEPGCDSRSQIVRSVDIICHALRDAYTFEQCERFYHEIARFVASSEQEQIGRLNERLPTLKEYWDFRLGTSAVYIATAVGEYSTSSKLPRTVMDCSSMKAIWRETNLIVSITNDLLSLKKEMKHGCVDNIVSLTFASTNDLHIAVDHSIVALRHAKLRFDKAAQKLLSAPVDEKHHLQVANFIDVQQSYCVGNLIWRYSMHESLGSDGSLTFTL